LISILITDDHVVVYQALKQPVPESSDIVAANEAGNGKAAREKASKGNSDVAVLDITMPGLYGPEVLK